MATKIDNGFIVVDGNGARTNGLLYETRLEALKFAAQENGRYVKAVEYKRCTLCKNVFQTSCDWCNSSREEKQFNFYEQV